MPTAIVTIRGVGERQRLIATHKPSAAIANTIIRTAAHLPQIQSPLIADQSSMATALEVSRTNNCGRPICAGIAINIKTE